MGSQKSKMVFDYDIDLIDVDKLHISYYIGHIGIVDYGEGNLNVSRKEIEEIVKHFLERANSYNHNYTVSNENKIYIVYKTYIDSLTKTIKKEAVLLEDERQEPMTRGIQNEDCCFGTAIKLFFVKDYIYGVLFVNGTITARISFY